MATMRPVRREPGSRRRNWPTRRTRLKAISTTRTTRPATLNISSGMNSRLKVAEFCTALLIRCSTTSSEANSRNAGMALR